MQLASAIRMNLASSLQPISLLPYPSLIRTTLPVLLSSSISLSEEPSGNNSETDTTNRGGWDPTKETVNSSQTTSLSKMEHIKQLTTSPRPRASFYMAMAMALHFGGYEFVRSGMLALFTSSEVGFASSGAFPLAMGLVSPFSAFLLYGYGTVLQKQGPRAALRATTLFSLVVFAVTTGLLQISQSVTHTAAVHIASQAVVALAFVYQNSYAHLLYNQHWSFLSSVMTPEEGSIWFASIAGLSSIVCTITGTIVKPLVKAVGLAGTVSCNCLFLLISLFFADRAYQLSEIHGFDPSSIRKPSKTTKTDKKDTSEDNPSSSLVLKAKDLFKRVPALGALFGEVLTFQSMSVILNIAMITQLKISMPNDADRAAWTGRFFAAVSGVSGLFQFIFIPLFLKRIEPRLVWKVMPIIPLLCSAFQSFQGSSPTLEILALSFFAAKTMDYSIRGVVNEMVYQPLDFDSRYLGKEIIGVFGSRFGKSGVSLCLSGLAYVFPNFGIYHLSKMSVVASTSWLGMSWWLSQLVPRKAEAQEAFLEQRRQNQSDAATRTESENNDKEKEE